MTEFLHLAVLRVLSTAGVLSFYYLDMESRFSNLQLDFRLFLPNSSTQK